MIETAYLARLSRGTTGWWDGFVDTFIRFIVGGEEQQRVPMDSVNQQVMEKFAEFERERDPSSIYEALDLIEATEAPLPIADAAARKLAVSRRLSFFAVLDRNI